MAKDGNLMFRDRLTLTWRMGFGQIRCVNSSKSCWQFDVVPLCVFLCRCHFPWHLVWNCTSLSHFVHKQCLTDWHLFDRLTDLKMMHQRHHVKERSMTWRFTVLANGGLTHVTLTWGVNNGSVCRFSFFFMNGCSLMRNGLSKIFPPKSLEVHKILFPKLSKVT